MKSINIYITMLFILTLFQTNSNAQVMEDACGTESLTMTSSTEGLIGGRYKPAVSNIGGAPEGSDYFPVLILFVQFAGETGGSTTDINDWPGGSAPNFMSSTIRSTRVANNSTWWNSYDGYDVSDYWNEQSRGKLHVIGEAISVILSHNQQWYYDNYIPGYPGWDHDDSVYSGAQARMNQEIMDYIKQPSVGINWSLYDKWKTVDEGNFSWESDGKVDMIYKIHRTGYLGHRYATGVSALGICGGATADEYTVYSSGLTTIKVNFSYGRNGSGLNVQGRSGVVKRDLFQSISWHEMGHYLFGSGHITYSKMTKGGGNEFCFSPWDMIKMGYMTPKVPDFTNPIVLGDYSTRYGTAGDEGEIVQVPINSSGTEFFLIANRRKVSHWDNRIAGDSLGMDENSFLMNRNPEIGKGLYIYHITDGYVYPSLDETRMDLECADGLWNWTNSGTTCYPIWGSPSGTHPVFIHDLTGTNNGVSYNNDYSSGTPGPTDSDDISYYNYYSGSLAMGMWYSPGKMHTTSPWVYGTNKVFTNDKEYYYSYAAGGDRWDAWNVGYNEVFSPYSSPNTKDWSNNGTGIFIWYKYLNGSTNEAVLHIYQTDNGYKESEILDMTPPSRPMGLRADQVTGLNSCHPKLVWNHNMEPDMVRGDNQKRYEIYRATQTSMSYVPTNYTLLATVDISASIQPYYVDETIDNYFCSGSESLPVGDMYPVRYKIRAVDNGSNDNVRRSVFSDFVAVTATNYGAIDPGDPESRPGRITEENQIPTKFALYQNYPNPFNPITSIQYDLPKDNFVTIKVYDILGKQVAELINEYKQAGSYITSFDGSKLSSGIYFYKIETKDFISTKRMILVK